MFFVAIHANLDLRHAFSHTKKILLYFETIDQNPKAFYKFSVFFKYKNFEKHSCVTFLVVTSFTHS